MIRMYFHYRFSDLRTIILSYSLLFFLLRCQMMRGLSYKKKQFQKQQSFRIFWRGCGCVCVRQLFVACGEGCCFCSVSLQFDAPFRVVKSRFPVLLLDTFLRWRELFTPSTEKSGRQNGVFDTNLTVRLPLFISFLPGNTVCERCA